MNEDKVKLKLNIAGESIVISVADTKQEETRQVEEEVNMLFDTWRHRFPEKSDRELLAMIAFRYAEQYSALRKDRERTQRGVESLIAQLQGIVAEGGEGG